MKSVGHGRNRVYAGSRKTKVLVSAEEMELIRHKEERVNACPIIARERALKKQREDYYKSLNLS